LEHGAGWILLLNNDVIMEPGALAEMIRVGEETPDTGIVGPAMQRTLRPDLIDLGGDLDFRWGRVLLRQYAPSLNGHDKLPVDYVWGCTLMARRAVFERIGGLEPVYVAYFEDAELCLRAARLGYRTVTALRARVVHQVGRSGEKRFAWQTYLRMRNHALFFLRLGKSRHWPTLIPALILVQLPLIFVRSVRVYLARKIRRRKYADRPITLWGYNGHVQRPTPKRRVDDIRPHRSRHLDTITDHVERGSRCVYPTVRLPLGRGPVSAPPTDIHEPGAGGDAA
jgi:GT2 family glycosyltransferase